MKKNCWKYLTARKTKNIKERRPECLAEHLPVREIKLDLANGLLWCLTAKTGGVIFNKIAIAMMMNVSAREVDSLQSEGKLRVNELTSLLEIADLQCWCGVVHLAKKWTARIFYQNATAKKYRTFFRLFD